MQHEATRQEYVTRAVFSLTGYGLLFTIVVCIIVNIAIGQPMWWPVQLMLQMGLLIGLGWIIVRAGHWRAARYLIPLVFIFLGTYVTAQPDLNLGAAGVLEYVLAVILTAILLTVWIGFIGWPHRPGGFQTYENAKYGYQIEYPRDWDISGASARQSKIVDNKPAELDGNFVFFLKKGQCS